VVGDVYDAAQVVGERGFDIVYTGLGALVWLPDLPRWADVVASLLADGGRLYLAEFHPFTYALDQEGRVLAHDYFDTCAHAYDHPMTYTDGPALTRTVSVQWQHTLGEVITAVAGAGLRIEFCHEHPTTLFPQFSVLQRSAAGEYGFPPDRPRIPLMYSVRAVKA